jgi:hypothetical protein
MLCAEDGNGSIGIRLAIYGPDLLKIVIASEAKQSIPVCGRAWIASSLCSSQ